MIERKDKPIEMFGDWLSMAKSSGHEEPTAMTLATASKQGRPSARVVLLKEFDERGFVFYTNLKSVKSQDLIENPYASLCFHWLPIGKQVRIEGRVEQVDDAEADTYFATRPRKSKLGAWASRQSEVLEKRFTLEERLARYTLKFGTREIPRPTFWSGYRVVPEKMEFWSRSPFRIHERLIFKHKEDGGWQKSLLYP